MLEWMQDHPVRVFAMTLVAVCLATWQLVNETQYTARSLAVVPLALTLVGVGLVLLRRLRSGAAVILGAVVAPGVLYGCFVLFFLVG